MHYIDLNGPWTLTRKSTGDHWAAAVPGCVHSDLRTVGVIKDMDWRDNEALQQWIVDEDWLYGRDFSVSAEQLTAGSLMLECDGLDTLASISINGTTVLSADNMFRRWSVDIKSQLIEGKNRIEILFTSPLPTMEAGQAKRPMTSWNIYSDRYRGRAYVRKMACSFGWDWGPIAPTAGIWKAIRIVPIVRSRIEDLRISQEHKNGVVTLRCQWRPSVPSTATLRVSKNGTVLQSISCTAGQNSANITIDNPSLWWPNDLGDRPLYDVTLELTDGTTLADSQTRRIGLRKITLQRKHDETGESFTFEINGKPFFAKGVNWVPHRILLTDITPDDYRRLIDDTADSGMNMIRVWGGGIYESEAFYEACDKRGVLVWQDMAFACGTYPITDKAFMANVREEVIDNINRLRHHASLALWCGNNELEMGFAGKPEFTWEEYGKLFDTMLPELVREHDGETPYWPGSPHTPVGNRDHGNDDASGDAHHWDVFFGNKPFEAQREWKCRFMSEYGFQSFPEFKTVAAFSDKSDWNITSRIMDYHQRSQMGNRTIFSYLLDWYQLPTDFANALFMSQVTQSTCVRYAAEHLRRIQPLCQGVLFWQINDIWPCASWSSIDSFGRWKVLQYESKRFFAPVMVSLEESRLAKQVKVHISNQRWTTLNATVTWKVTDTDGVELGSKVSTVSCAPQSGEYVAVISCDQFLTTRMPHDLLIWATCEENGTVVSRNLVTISRPKHLSLAQPQITWKTGHDTTGDFVELTAKRPALYVWLKLAQDDVWFSDNAFHLLPGEVRRVYVRRGPSLEKLGAQMQISSLAECMTGVRESGSTLAPRPEGFRQWFKEGDVS